MTKKTKKKINLALQGGGSHGAYTWGVLDRLLEEDDLIIEGISGTSAGAMNAALLVSGYMKGGNAGAKQSLEEFWRHVSDAAAFSPLHKSPLERMLTGWNMDFSPMYHALDIMSRLFSPYEINPLGFNPMRPILEHMLDLDALRACDEIKLFITATHVASGQARVFRREEITHDVLLASACIPFIFQAVEIEGENYWDGGYMGNPAIWPLIYNCDSEDVVLVQINPIHDNKLPRSAADIINRLNEITFNSSLISEMRAIDFVSKLLHDERLERGRYKDMRVHLIYSAEHMKHLNASSKMNADWDFFMFLKDIGRQTAEEWLQADWKDVGVRGTVDIRKKFLAGPGTQPHMGDMAEMKAAAKKHMAQRKAAQNKKPKK
ncbi:MAG: patatin-like phospholipase family protein [Alphaproteobacteria bacterium]|nr:patatin-like phospholipase family protein [Alphaproteobacteria bacterium]